MKTMTRQMETTTRQADVELVEQLAAGHEGALAEVYRRHGGPVLGLAKRLLRDPNLAEEIVQEVMLRLWNNPEKFDGSRGSLRSYLLAHTHGRSVDLIRSESSRRMREQREAQLAVEAGLSLATRRLPSCSIRRKEPSRAGSARVSSASTGC